MDFGGTFPAFVRIRTVMCRSSIRDWTPGELREFKRLRIFTHWRLSQPPDTRSVAGDFMWSLPRGLPKNDGTGPGHAAILDCVVEPAALGESENLPRLGGGHDPVDDRTAALRGHACPVHFQDLGQSGWGKDPQPTRHRC